MQEALPSDLDRWKKLLEVGGDLALGVSVCCLSTLKGGETNSEVRCLHSLDMRIAAVWFATASNGG